MTEYTESIAAKVGKCPACRGFLWADVTIAVKVTRPKLDDDGQASVLATARPISTALAQHECVRDDES